MSSFKSTADYFFPSKKKAEPISKLHSAFLSNSIGFSWIFLFELLLNVALKLLQHGLLRFVQKSAFSRFFFFQTNIKRQNLTFFNWKYFGRLDGRIKRKLCAAWRFNFSLALLHQTLSTLGFIEYNLGEFLGKLTLSSLTRIPMLLEFR